jgi:murein DD-endopeptidase MepM/ murein hydrolase activator NlpD
MQLSIKSFVFLCTGVMTFISVEGNAGEQFNPGFFSPTGDTQSQVSDGWLANGCGPGESYVSGLYHIGIDFPLSYDSLVYALWDGVVVDISPNGWGDGNVGIVVKSKLENGQDFLWLVGHVQAATSPNLKAQVVKGAVISRVGHYFLEGQPADLNSPGRFE